MDESRMQEDGSDESEIRNLGHEAIATTTCSPEPLIGLAAIEATKTTYVLNRTKLIWRVCGIIEA
jgi:hypothetical protein